MNINNRSANETYLASYITFTSMAKASIVENKTNKTAAN